MRTGKEIREQVRNDIQKMEESAVGIADDGTYYTCQEFAKKYGYKEGTIRQLLHRGQISGAVRLYGRWAISENANILVRQYTKKNRYEL